MAEEKQPNINLSANQPQLQPSPNQTQIPVPQTPVQQQSIIQPPKKGNTKKTLIGCLAGFVFLVIVALVLIFIFLGSPGAQRTPLAEALGIQPKVLLDTLTLIVRIFFLTLAFGLFISTMIGIFKTAGTKKDDPSRKGSVVMAAVSGVALILNLFLWGGAELYLYEKGKTIESAPKKAAIATEPKDLGALMAPVTVKFDATGLAEKAPRGYKIINFEWNFGDNEKGNGQIVSHEYKDKGKELGKFTTTLTVVYKDDSGKEKTEEYAEKIYITIVNVKPRVEIKADPEKGEAPLLVNFDASGAKDIDGKITGYAWDFEGTSDPRIFTDSVNALTTHAFKNPGVYTVKLKVTDDAKGETIAEKVITVEEAKTPRPSIKVSAEASGKFTAGKTYLFDGSESMSPAGNIQKYEWNFGDGTSPQQSKMISHSFAKAGEYSVALKITDETGATGEFSKKITVIPPASAPTANIKTTPAKDKEMDKSLTGRVPFEVKFDASSSTDPDNNITEYQWDFDGNGASDSFGPQAAYIYMKEGRYEAKLTVIDADKNQSEAVLLIDVKPAGIQAKVSASPASGSVPLSVIFDASGSSYANGKIISYEWDFGDGTPKRLDTAKITYKYSKIGSFTASVTAIGADNARDTTKILITVAEVPLKACFEITKHSGPAPLTVVFTATCSTGTISTFKWDLDGDNNFDDGAGAEITHKFDTPGTYNVSLEVSDLNNVTDASKDTITVTAP